MRYLSLAFAVLIVSHCAFLAAEDASELRQRGIAALKESQTNPRAIVEAARCFAKAGALFSAANDDEKAVEMNSFLYWCKKKMSMQDIDQFIKGGEADVAAKINEVEKAAPGEDAQKAFDRADKFAQGNPDEHLLIAIRFYEVAGRFKGTDASLNAQDRSLKEQLLDKSSSGTKPVAQPTMPAETAKERRAAPSSDDVKAAEKLIKDLFQEEYAKSDAATRLALNAKLLQQADENKSDAASEYVLLHEARDVATLAGDATLAMQAQTRLSDAFKLDSVALMTDLRRLEALTKQSESGTAMASLYVRAADEALAAENYDQAVRFNSRAEDLIPVIKDAALKARLKAEIPRVLALKKESVAAFAAQKALATKPNDRDANLVAGKFALLLGQFEKSFILLSKGSDGFLVDIAKQEATAPQDAADQTKLADAWFDRAGKETSSPFLKARMQERAATWYATALPGLTGLGKLKIETKLKLLPQTQAIVGGIPEGPAATRMPAKLENRTSAGLGKLYVSCGDKVDIKFNNRIVGRSSQWGDLVPIPLSLKNGDTVFFITKGESKHTYGVSWVYISNDKKYFAVSNTKNTPGFFGVLTNESKFAETVKGEFWVNNLMNRMDKSIVALIQPPEAVCAKSVQGDESPKGAVYRWDFDIGALVPIRADEEGKPAPKALKPTVNLAALPPLFQNLTVKLNKLENWLIESGTWTEDGEGILGVGDSSLKFKTKLPPTFTLDFTMNVKDGMRPRIRFGDGYIGNEGYSKILNLYGMNVVEGKELPYTNNQVLKIRSVFSKSQIELFVNDTSVAKAKRKSTASTDFKLSAGDDWSKGTVLFSNFVISPSPDSN